MDFSHLPSSSSKPIPSFPEPISPTASELEGHNVVRSIQSLNLDKDYMSSFVRAKPSSKDEKEWINKTDEKNDNANNLNSLIQNHFAKKVADGEDEGGGSEGHEGKRRKIDEERKKQEEKNDFKGRITAEGGRSHRDSFFRKGEHFLGERKIGIVVEGLVFREESGFKNSESCRICGSEFSIMKLRKKNWYVCMYFWIFGENIIFRIYEKIIKFFIEV
jgi:hypothetical protein